MMKTERGPRRLLTALTLMMLVAVVPYAAAEQKGENVETNRAATQLLFIHHSCGGQLLAAPGEQVDGFDDGAGRRCIYTAHPNGGGLRADLEAAGYAVNEASYGSIIGEDTDICHWRKKFTDRMDDILRLHMQDEMLPDGMTNEIVAFKSCFPNNQFVGRGEGQGDPDSCELTVANAQAAYRSLLPLFLQHPDVLYVAFTAPPLADPPPVGMKQKIKRWIKGEPEHFKLAREFNDWMADAEGGWLAGYDLPNVVVFNYYDILTKFGQTDGSAYATKGGTNSHPSDSGNRKAAELFVPFLEKARAGMPGAGN